MSVCTVYSFFGNLLSAVYCLLISMMVLSHEFQKGSTMIDYKYFFVYVLTLRINGCGLGFLSLRFIFY